MTNLSPGGAREGAPAHLASPWFIAEGGVLVLLGLLAAVLPAAAGIAGALVFGWLLVIAGTMGLVSHFGARGHTHTLWAGFSALVALVVGVLIIGRPLVGAITLALLLAAYLVVDAVAMLGMGLDQRRRARRGWIWLIVSGLVDAALALVILGLGPLSDLVLLGFVIALDLLVAGAALLIIGLAGRGAKAA